METLSYSREPVSLGLLWLVVLLPLGVLIWYTGIVVGAILGILAGVCLTATVSLASHTSPGGRSGASILAILTAGLLVGAIASAAQPFVVDVEMLLRIWGTLIVILCSYGASAAATGALSAERMVKTGNLVVLTLLPIIGYAVWFSPLFRAIGESEPVITGEQVGELRADVGELMFDPTADIVGLGSFLVFVFLVWVIGTLCIPRITFHEVLREAYREPIETGLARLYRFWFSVLIYTVFGIIIGTIVVGGLVAIVVLIDPSLEDVMHEFTEVVLDTLIVLAGVASLRWLLALVGGVFVLGWLLSQFPTLARLQYTRLSRWVPAMTGGFVSVVLIHLVYPRIHDAFVGPWVAAREVTEVQLPIAALHYPVIDLVEVTAPPTAYLLLALAVVVLLGGFVFIVSLLAGLALMGFFPERTAPGALAAAGLVAAAVLLGVAGAPTLVIAGVIVSALMTWELTRHTAGMIVELGSGMTSAAVVVTHVVGLVLVGVLTVAVVVGAEYAVVEIEPAFNIGVLIPLVVAVVLGLAAIKKRVDRVSV